METPPVLQMAFQYSILVPQDEDKNHSHANGDSANGSASSRRYWSSIHTVKFLNGRAKILEYGGVMFPESGLCILKAIDIATYGGVT